MWATFSPGVERQPKEVIGSRNWDHQVRGFPKLATPR